MNEWAIWSFNKIVKRHANVWDDTALNKASGRGHIVIEIIWFWNQNDLQPVEIPLARTHVGLAAAVAAANNNQIFFYSRHDTLDKFVEIYL